MKKLYIIVFLISTVLTLSARAQNNAYKVTQHGEENQKQLFCIVPLTAQELKTTIPEQYCEKSCSQIKIFLISGNSLLIISAQKTKTNEGWSIISQATCTVVTYVKTPYEQEENYKIDSGLIKLDASIGLILFVDLKLKRIDLRKT